MIKKYASLVIAVLFCGFHAFGALKVWVSGETLRYSDLNSNFSQINTSATRSLVNADLGASAAIAHSKLATPGLLPKAVAKVGVTGTPCAAGACSVVGAYGGVTAAHTGTGVYTMTFPTAGSTNYIMFVSTTASNVLCDGQHVSATTATVNCNNVSTAAATDTVFSFLLFY